MFSRENVVDSAITTTDALHIVALVYDVTLTYCEQDTTLSAILVNNEQRIPCLICTVSNKDRCSSCKELLCKECRKQCKAYGCLVCQDCLRICKECRRTVCASHFIGGFCMRDSPAIDSWVHRRGKQ